MELMISMTMSGKVLRTVLFPPDSFPKCLAAKHIGNEPPGGNTLCTEYRYMNSKYLQHWQRDLGCPEYT
jgi:hypothetical protein